MALGSSVFPIPDSRFPIPDSRFPFPSWEGLGVGSDSRFPIPCSEIPCATGYNIVLQLLQNQFNNSFII
ncbi:MULTISPECIES: hypothetical protein [Moorena]|uniref:hypothetical protein n=1 Tax=Moorena TaxID=1155738 RepID=UPI0002DD20DB|nr:MULTISPECIES: hypothetical protein [Moorena]NEP65762.1 hypothetical protein [Moorena sp. SIO3A5]